MKGERDTQSDNTTRNTQNSWKLYYIIPCRFCFFEKRKISCIECSICYYSLSLTLPPRAQYNTTPHFYLTFLRLSLLWSAIRACLCMWKLTSIRIHMVEDFIKFPFFFCFFPPLHLCVHKLLFGPERRAWDWETLASLNCATNNVRLYWIFGLLFPSRTR